jgi:septum formation protein
MNKRIYLASRSPRRAELLQQLGITFEILPSDIDESVVEGESPANYVTRLAREKAEACLISLQSNKATTLAPILAADTTVSIDGVILGKPESDEDAYAMLARMSGRRHEVHTGIAVATESGIEVALSTTYVQMGNLSDADIRAYIATGEPHDKAGAYGIQGLAGTFIRHIEGSYSGVMGLPIYETSLLLKNAGVQILG